MYIQHRNPFLLKFLSSIDGYFQLFITPILIFLTTNNIKLSGLFFFFESFSRFCSYGFAGSISNTLNIRTVIRSSHIARFISTMLTFVIFYSNFSSSYKFLFFIINNIFFIWSNSILTTSFENLFQKHNLFNPSTQSQIASADLFSGGFALLIILILSFLKIDFYWLIPVYIFAFSLAAIQLHKKLPKNLKSIPINAKSTIVQIFNDFIATLKILKNDDDMLKNTFIGYIPFSFFLIVEQSNIFHFTSLYNESTMKILHFGFKTILFFGAGLIVPLLMNKCSDVHKLLKYSIVLMIFGSIGSICTTNVYINVLSILLLGFAHYLVLNYRKIKRRNIMIKKNITFSTLGFFFAIEGLSGMISNLYLSIFGSNPVTLVILFVTGIISMIIFYLSQKKSIGIL